MIIAQFTITKITNEYIRAHVARIDSDRWNGGRFETTENKGTKCFFFSNLSSFGVSVCLSVGINIST